MYKVIKFYMNKDVSVTLSNCMITVNDMLKVLSSEYKFAILDHKFLA